MHIPDNLKYTQSDEWILDEGDGVISVGITDHAQEQLGDLVLVDLPAVGKKVASGDDAVVIESVKAAADVYAPVAGTIIEINDALSSAPELVNQDAYGAWLFKMKIDQPAALAELLSPEDYRAQHQG